MDKFYQ